MAREIGVDVDLALKKMELPPVDQTKPQTSFIEDEETMFNSEIVNVEMEQAKMKINLKVLIALIVIVAVGYWAVISILPRSYSGSALNFGVGSGTVTVTNPSTESVPAQLVAKSRSFRVSSAVESLSATCRNLHCRRATLSLRLHGAKT
jgi:hypothetical protein